MKNSLLYRGFRYPAEIISHVVWLYFRFSLSFRDIEELMASRGIIVTYETIRQWTLKFGQGYANELRRRQPQRGNKWRLDEVVLTIKGSTITYGAQSTRTVMCSISSCKAGVTGRRKNAFSASSSRACVTHRGCWSPTN
jgi:hypothetical protein